MKAWGKSHSNPANPSELASELAQLTEKIADLRSVLARSNRSTRVRRTLNPVHAHQSTTGDGEFPHSND